LLSRPVGRSRTITAPLALGSLLAVVRGGVRVALRTLGAHEVVEPGGDLPLSLLVGVQVDQRGLLGGLPGTDHRVLHWGAVAAFTSTPALRDRARRGHARLERAPPSRRSVALTCTFT
jgi:hypothetical protein